MNDNHVGRPTLGVVAICKNEEQDLPGFLRHLQGWVDEIVIVDDGSTDASLDILRQAGDKVTVIEQEMSPEEGFAGQRNKGIAQAGSDWLLHMDIDERVTPELAAEIQQATYNTPYHAFRYRRLNFFLHRPMQGGSFRGWNNPQLAKRGYHHFQSPVHESCVIQGGEASIGQLQATMWHFNEASYQKRMEKSLVYCRHVANRLKERGMIVRWHHFLLMPGKEFIRQYLFKKGFVDRTPGLVLCMHSACAMFKACALVWDEQNRLSREELEEQLISDFKDRSPGYMK